MAKHDKTIEYVGDSRVPAKRTPNIAPSYAEFPGKSEAFWPNFLLKEWMVAAVVLIAFLILTVSHPSPLETKADPNNASYIPLPDWYFLFLYQLLKYPWQSGDWVVFGVVVVPGIAFGALLLAPWLDTSPERKPSKRPVATILMLLSIVSIFYLTWSAIDEHNRLHPKAAGGGAGGAAAAKPPADFKPDQIWTKQASCQGCHGANMEGANGPALWNVGSRLDEKAIHDVIVNGRGAMPKGMFNGSPEELDQLVKYLASLKGDGKGGAAGGAPAPAAEAPKPEGGDANKGGESAAAPTGGTAEEGKTMANQCLACHGQDLKGGMGPSLVGVVDKLKPEGVAGVLKNGRGAMPPLGASWSDQQMSSMIEYLKTVK
ncbi:c-type cytochrome [Aneurinibacillus sp. BA2021]|nr:c-type cytochrome [Aneurinibacillus sp. BA2021]